MYVDLYSIRMTSFIYILYVNIRGTGQRRGSALNQDGRSSNLTSPNGPSQSPNFDNGAFAGVFMWKYLDKK